MNHTDKTLGELPYKPLWLESPRPINPTLESHTSNVKLKSHIFYLTPNNLPNFTSVTYKQAGCALAHWLVTCKNYDFRITIHTTYLHLRDMGVGSNTN